MGQFAVLQWERRRLSGLIAESQAGALQVLHGFTMDWPDQFDPIAAPIQAAERIKQRLPANIAWPARVIISLSREDVILRHLDVPDVADAELPDIVRFQAAARSTVSLDQLLLDFLPLAKLPGSEGRPVLLVTASKQLTQGIQTVLQAAGIETSVITFSSIGLTECVCHVERQHQPARAVLTMIKDGDRIEMAILSDRRLLFAHAARLPGADSSSVSALLSEANRAIVAAQRLHPHLQLQQAYLFDRSDASEELISPLAERLGVPVAALMPILPEVVSLSTTVLPAKIPAWPVLVGLALAEGDRLSLPLDFLHPRQPPAQVNRRKLQLAVGSAAALLVLAISVGGVELVRGSLQRQLEKLQQEDVDLDVKLKPGQTVLQAARLVDQWQAGNLNQLQRLSMLEELMEGTERLYLSQYTFTAGHGESLGSVQALGNAKSREDITQFQQRLMDTKAFRIQPRQVTQSGRDDDYPNRFELHADLLPKSAEKPTPLNAQPSTLKP